MPATAVVELLLNDVAELTKRFTTMTDFIFVITAQFCAGQTTRRIQKNRVITKTTDPATLMQNRTPPHGFDNDRRPLVREREHRSAMKTTTAFRIRNVL